MCHTVRPFQALRKVTVTEVAKKNHSYLDLFKTPQLRKITLCSGLFWYQTMFLKTLSAAPPVRPLRLVILTVSLYLQVCRCLPLLRDQLQDLRFRRQYLPHAVHLRRRRSSRQNLHLLHPGLDRPEERAGVVSDHNWSSDWNKHCHTFRWHHCLSSHTRMSGKRDLLRSQTWSTLSYVSVMHLHRSTLTFVDPHTCSVCFSFRVLGASYLCRCGGEGFLRGSVHHRIPLLSRALPNRPQVKTQTWNQ